MKIHVLSAFVSASAALMIRGFEAMYPGYSVSLCLGDGESRPTLEVHDEEPAALSEEECQEMATAINAIGDELGASAYFDETELEQVPRIKTIEAEFSLSFGGIDLGGNGCFTSVTVYDGRGGVTHYVNGQRVAPPAPAPFRGILAPLLERLARRFPHHELTA